jgi:hypothetical protein
MAADYIDVCWKVFLEGGNFGRFAGGLTADYGTLFRSCEERLVIASIEKTQIGEEGGQSMGWTKQTGTYNDHS